MHLAPGEGGVTGTFGEPDRVGTLTGDDYKQGGHIIAGTPRVYLALVAALAPLAPKDLA